MKTLKVIQVIDSLNVGGAEMLAVNLANGLAHVKVESHLCATRKEGSLQQQISQDVGYLFLEKKKTLDIKAILHLKRYCKLHNISIIHAHSSSLFIAFCVKLLYPRIKIVWHDHFGNSEFIAQRKTYPLRLFSLGTAAIIAVNTKLKEWSTKKMLTKEVHLINNFAHFKKEDKVTKLKGKAGKRIVHVGGYREQKDHFNLLKAFKIIHQKHQDWTLHLIGKNYKDSYGNAVSNYINEHHLQDAVFEYGIRTDISNILSQAEIGVLSSASEGLPISLLEYGLTPLCVLVTDVGECRNVVDDKNALVKPNDSVTFAEKLNILIENEELRETIQKNFHQRILRNYSRDSVIEKIIKLYHKI